MTVVLLTADFQTLDPLEVTVSIRQPGAGIEPSQRKPERVQCGRWQVKAMPFPIAGRWQIGVTVLITDFEQVELADTLTLP